MVSVQQPPLKVPLVDQTGHATHAFRDWLFRLWTRSGGADDLIAETNPPGLLALYGAPIAPTGWLLCDGADVSRQSFSRLFAIIGTTWGTGNGTTTFSLPDFRGRVPIGAGLGSGLTNRILAASGGEEDHVLTEAELAIHDHSVTDPTHAHPAASGSFVVTGGVAVYEDGITTAGTAEASTAASTTGVTVDNAGSDIAHNNMQPFAVATMIIKT